MPDQKIDNLLNLAMDATPQERRKSGNLNIGYDPATRLWDVIIKYSGPESGLAGNGIQVVPLLGSYAVVTECRWNLWRNPNACILNCFRQREQAASAQCRPAGMG